MGHGILRSSQGAITGGFSGSLAPNVVAATCSIIGFQAYGNATQPVFGGTFTCPVTVTNLAHLIVRAFKGPLAVEIARFDSGFTSSGVIAYSGASSEILETGTSQTGWAVRFECYDANYLEAASPFTVSGLTIAAATITSLSATDDTADRWNDGPNGLGGAVHAIIPVTVTCAIYPQKTTIATISPQYGLIVHGWFDIWGAFENVVNIGAQVGSVLVSPGSPTAIYPPTLADETVTVYAAIGVNLAGDPTTWPGVVSTTVLVHAPPAPLATAATGAWIDEVLVYPTTRLFGWNNLYVDLPFGDPNFKGARFTVTNGHYTTPGNPATFVAGDPATAQHGGLEVRFDDWDSARVQRRGNTISVQVNDPAALWSIPDYMLSGNVVNPDDVFRIRNLIASPLAASVDDDATWTRQNDWSNGVGDSTPGTAAYQDIVFDLSTGLIQAGNIDPASLGDGVHLVGGQLAAKLAALGGLAFDSSGGSQASLGYTMRLDSSGNIVISNLPVVYTLPSLPSAAYGPGSVILDFLDHKVYRTLDGYTWQKGTDPADLVAGAIATGVSIAANQIAAGTLTAGVAYIGTLTASQVISGTFSGLSMVLNLNGITTTLGNIYDSTYSYVGLKCEDNSTSAYTALHATGIGSVYPSGGGVFSLGTSSSLARVFAACANNNTEFDVQLTAALATLALICGSFGIGLNVTSTSSILSLQQSGEYMEFDVYAGGLTKITASNFPSSSPGSKGFYYDPSDANRVHYVP